MSDRPNLIERMGEIVAAADRLIGNEAVQASNEAISDADHIYGVAGEVLTMIDGR